MSTYTDFSNFLEVYNRYRAEYFRVYITFNELSNDVSFVFVARNFVISTCLRMTSYTDFVIFLEDGNRYKAENFTIHLYFNRLSNDISHNAVAQNFIISTCLRMSTYTDFVNFLEDFNRYKAEIFRVY